MKGDFTRFTFQPQKHYSSVLMQQGRVQLDADWNEQMSILNELDRVQIRDIIGSAAGTSQTEGGYAILPASVNDVQVSVGTIAISETNPLMITISDTDATFVAGYAIAINNQTRFVLEAKQGTDFNSWELTLNASFDTLISDASSNTTTTFQYQASVTDLLITPGRFYIDGKLCELNEGDEISVERLSTNQVRIPFATLDGQPFAVNQWVEIAVKQVDSQKDVTLRTRNKIKEVNTSEFTLTFAEAIAQPTNGQTVQLRRLTSYRTQPGYTETQQDSLKDSAIYLAYLDQWERHVTALDDRDLQEVALRGLDTTTRLQVMAQVKLLDITAELDDLGDKFFVSGKLIAKPALSALEALPAWEALSRRAVFMTATTATAPDSPIDTSGNYLGGDNRLYRVEIHQGGTIEDATFKWSRDNGSIVSAIAEIKDDVIFLKGSVQDEYKLFSNQSSSQLKENPWVEILTEADEMNNRPGILVRVRDVKPPNLLLLDMSQVQGLSLPKTDRLQAREQKFKVRRWDGLSGTTDTWQSLEQGIQVQFGVDNDAIFQPGDYWLIQARSDLPIAWSRDLPQAKQQLGKPIPQRPDGIEHRYGILSIVQTTKVGNDIIFSSAIPDDLNWEQADLRSTFIPLLSRAGLAGIKTEEARLHVTGDVEQTAQGKIEAIVSTPPKIRITETTAQIYKGYTLTIDPGTGPESRLVTAVDSRAGGSLEITLDKAFNSLLPDSIATFRYSQPVIRFETSDATAPQFFLNGNGSIGINTFNPTAKVDIQGLAGEEAIALLHVKNSSGDGLLNVQPDGKISLGINNPFNIQPNGNVGINIDPPEANLHVQTDFRVSDGVNFLHIQPQNNFVRLASNSGVAIVTGTNSNPAFLAIQPQGGSPVRFTANAGYSFNTITTTGSAGFFRIEPQDNGPVNFTSNQGYRFDKDITIVNNKLRIVEAGQEKAALAKDGLTLTEGNVAIAKGGVELQDGNVEIAKGNVEIQNGILKIGDFEITEDGITSDDTNFRSITVRNRINLGGFRPLLDIFTQAGNQIPRFNPPIAFANNIAVQQGGIRVEQGDLAITGGNASLTLTGNNADLTLSGNRAKIVLSGATLVANTDRLSISKGLVVGDNYANSSNAFLQNGLLVDGHVGIGSFGSPSSGQASLLAKLQVQASDTPPPNDGVLNITNSGNRSLLCVRSDGFVGINTRDDTARLGSNIPAQAKSEDAKLYVKGNTFLDGSMSVNGNIVANDIKGTTVSQVSSRAVKENITTLSSQEAAELLKQLKPVKFNYTIPQDDHSLHAGFISEEVPELLASADRQTVRLLDVVAVLTKTVKDQREGILKLNQVVKQQQAAIAALTEKMAQFDKS